MSKYADDLALALELAELADSITLDRFEASDLEVSSKPDMTPVSDADLATEEEIYDSYSVKRFMKIDFSDSEQAPDSTTLCKFRNLLHKHGFCVLRRWW